MFNKEYETKAQKTERGIKERSEKEVAERIKQQKLGVIGKAKKLGKFDYKMKKIEF